MRRASNQWGPSNVLGFKLMREADHRLLLARDEHLMAQVEYLHAWVANLDSVLSAVKKAAQTGDGPAAEKAIDDYRAKASEIVEEAMAAKEKFPTHPGGLA